jgi:hypothetical protein
MQCYTPQQLFIAPERTEMLSQLNLGLQFTRLQVPTDGNFNELNNQFESDMPPDVITDVTFLTVPAHTELAPLPGYSVLLPELLSLLHSSSTTGDVQQSEVDVDGENDDVQIDAVEVANDEGSVSSSERVFLCVKMEPLGEGASPLTELAVRTYLVDFIDSLKGSQNTIGTSYTSALKDECCFCFATLRLQPMTVYLLHSKLASSCIVA